MNRLVIIGNGFDLAHGIKTSYGDFLLDYFKNSCAAALNSTIKQNNQSPYDHFYYYIDDLIEIRIPSHYNAIQLSEKLILHKNIKTFLEDSKSLKIAIKYHFQLIKNSVQKLKDYNWVDFEIEYFNFLIATKSAQKNSSAADNKIKNLNDHFDLLKEKLEAYLQSQQNVFNNTFDKTPLINCFCQDFLQTDFDTIIIGGNETPKKMLFLNFNYTNTVEPYVSRLTNKISSEINYIHGILGGAVGKPILGFADELDKRYSEFENEANDELFKHIKTFDYLKTNNYSNLTRFLELEAFQVHIYGHSCGLSDRTMLNEIFENVNCKSIKIYYHQKEDGTNDYTGKTYEIYRHFRDKNMMRKKVVNFKYCEPMP